MEVVAPTTLPWGVATAPLPGESTCGDRYVVKPFGGGVLVAAIDGVGHGELAASAARIAEEILAENAGESPEVLVRRCHQALRGTRGVVMSLGSLDVPRALLTWLGVGNVQGVLLRPGLTLEEAEESLLLRAGVLGANLPPLHEAVLPVSAGDTLIFATDGIAGDFSRGLGRNLPPQRAADAILARHRRATDDALVVVARLAGMPR